MVQSDGLVTEITQKVVALVTSNMERVGDSRIPIKKGSPEWTRTGLLDDSVVVADNLATIQESAIYKTIGHYPHYHVVEKALAEVLDLKITST